MMYTQLHQQPRSTENKPAARPSPRIEADHLHSTCRELLDSALATALAIVQEKVQQDSAVLEEFFAYRGDSE